jgi:hypothetical protein
MDEVQKPNGSERRTQSSKPFVLYMLLWNLLYKILISCERPTGNFRFGLVVKVPDHRSGGSVFDSRCYQMF